MLPKKQFEYMEAIIGSMTDEERKNPDLIDKSSKRRERIAKGSGRSVTEVNNLRKTLERQKEVAKQMAGMSESDMQEMQRKMQSGAVPRQNSVAPKSVYKRK